MTTMFSFLKVMVVLDTHWKSSYDWYRFRYGGFLGFFEWVGTGLEGRDLDQREGTSGVRKGGVITAQCRLSSIGQVAAALLALPVVRCTRKVSRLLNAHCGTSIPLAKQCGRARVPSLLGARKRVSTVH